MPFDRNFSNKEIALNDLNWRGSRKENRERKEREKTLMKSRDEFKREMNILIMPALMKRPRGSFAIVFGDLKKWPNAVTWQRDIIQGKQSNLILPLSGLENICLLNELMFKYLSDRSGRI
ncbi:hypothetical protein O9G_004966 [Rozella allomycis CSF55]|uniref:Uncharacterized protein n=1 Tax=Rozella allomycis (strain CSF55) TaxID=988480 RepID=A0A075AQ62_ROZAC|nr:hypothetical protein O9G_004966 [Rozella allomycis CSF55]|eukprot:EPZ30870.1 hypothetical protein O9G_004966 [Rozella allomycis CSF55]